MLKCKYTGTFGTQHFMEAIISSLAWTLSLPNLACYIYKSNVYRNEAEAKLTRNITVTVLMMTSMALIVPKLLLLRRVMPVLVCNGVRAVKLMIITSATVLQSMSAREIAGLKSIK